MSRFRNWKTKWDIASKLQRHLVFTFQVQNFQIKISWNRETKFILKGFYIK